MNIDLLACLIWKFTIMQAPGSSNKFQEDDDKIEKAEDVYLIFVHYCLYCFTGDYTILVCPGIANSSEAAYVCMFVNHAQSRGYRVAVLNHLGVLTSVPLTSSRIFTYGIHCTLHYSGYKPVADPGISKGGGAVPAR